MDSKQTNEPTSSGIRPIHSRIDHYELDMEKGTLSYHVVVTKADTLRAMTDEELAKFIASQRTDCYHCPVVVCVDACEVSWLDWLKEEAKE